MPDEYLDHLQELEDSPDIMVRLRGFSELDDDYYWKQGLLEAIAEIERLRQVIYLYVDSSNVRPEDQAVVDRIALGEGEQA